MILSKQQILEAQDLRRETITVPEWGGDVIVKTMTGTERNDWQRSLMGSDGEPDLSGAMPKLLARCLVDEHGARLFEEFDLQALGEKSGAVIERLINVAQRLNGLGREESAKGN
jgi:hypothetical protein